MTPEDIAEIESSIRGNAREGRLAMVCAALRAAWRERDEAKAGEEQRRVTMLADIQALAARAEQAEARVAELTAWSGYYPVRRTVPEVRE